MKECEMQQNERDEWIIKEKKSMMSCIEARKHYDERYSYLSPQEQQILKDYDDAYEKAQQEFERL